MLEMSVDLYAVQVLQVGLDISRADTACIQGDDLFLDAGGFGLVLLDDLRLKLTFAIPGDSDFDFSIFRGQRLTAVAITTVICCLALRVMLSVAQFRLKLSLKDFLHRTGE